MGRGKVYSYRPIQRVRDNAGAVFEADRGHELARSVGHRRQVAAEVRVVGGGVAVALQVDRVNRVVFGKCGYDAT